MTKKNLDCFGLYEERGGNYFMFVCPAKKTGNDEWMRKVNELFGDPNCHDKLCNSEDWMEWKQTNRIQPNSYEIRKTRSRIPLAFVSYDYDIVDKSNEMKELAELFGGNTIIPSKWVGDVVF